VAEAYTSTRVTYAFLGVAAAIVSLLLTPAVARLAARLGVMDVPTARKRHPAPVPRVGGVAVVLAGALAVAAGVGAGAALRLTPAVDLRAWTALLAGGACVVAVGLADDLVPLSPWAKLAGLVAAASVVIALGVRVERVTLLGTTHELGVLAVPVTLGWIVVLTNAFNLMDGLDGLATGLGIIAATTCGVLLAARGDAQGAMAVATLLGALCGFLPYNVGPARVFLGDSGSLLIGHVLGVTAITGTQKGATALAVMVPLLIFALPIAETVSSTARRFFSRPAAEAPRHPLADLGRRLRQVMEADRAHLHDRLADSGLSPRSVVFLLYAASAGLSLLALAVARVP
jgi:UDP-GlcNAc:undecaprenyl-phosphate GlcNAc-1-phosphate transferase